MIVDVDIVETSCRVFGDVSPSVECIIRIGEWLTIRAW